MVLLQQMMAKRLIISDEGRCSSVCLMIFKNTKLCFEALHGLTKQHKQTEKHGGQAIRDGLNGLYKISIHDDS